VSHESTISDLKKLTKQDLLKVDPKHHAQYLLGESDRTAIILLASLIEEYITSWLHEKMPALNSDERTALFNFEGPCGTFSARIKLAQALGLLDRPFRKRIEIIKEMRNTAAHSHAALHFDTPEIHRAVAALFFPEHRAEVMGWQRRMIRAAFTTLCMQITRALAQGALPDIGEFFKWLRVQELKPDPSPGI
jgi:DNA-binding MltR family transcriptional regulator